MKNSQKGFVVPFLLAIVAVFFIGGGVYVFEQTKPKHMEQQTLSTSVKETTVPLSADKYAGWNTYTNTVYHYSIKYPSNWYVNTQYSNQDFTPRGPTPHDYIGGDTSISNYSQAQLDQYHKTNGDLEYPSDHITVSWMFWKTPTPTNLNGAPVEVDSFKKEYKEDVIINGAPGIKLTILGQRDIGGATKPNSVGINFKLDGELVNIGYRFDVNNANVTKIADQIVNSFTIDKSKIKVISDTVVTRFPTMSSQNLPTTKAIYAHPSGLYQFTYPPSWEIGIVPNVFGKMLSKYYPYDTNISEKSAQSKNNNSFGVEVNLDETSAVNFEKAGSISGSKNFTKENITVNGLSGYRMYYQDLIYPSTVDEVRYVFPLVYGASEVFLYEKINAWDQEWFAKAEATAKTLKVDLTKVPAVMQQLQNSGTK